MGTNALTHKQQLLLEAVRKLIRRGESRSLDRLLGKRHPVEIASLFPHLNDWEARNLVSALVSWDHAGAAKVLLEVEPPVLSTILTWIERDDLVKILESLPSGDATTLVRYLPDPVATEVIQRLESNVSEEVEELLGYDEDTAGGLMSTDFFVLKEDVTIGEAIAALQQNSDSLAMAFYLYVVNDADQLVGVLSLRSLLTHPPETRLKDIMITEVLSVNVYTDQEEVAQMVAKYDLVAIPVVDDFNKLVGIVTVDDVLDVIREEATEDILKMAGTDEDDMVSRSMLRSVRTRIPWIGVTLGAGLLASEIVATYRGTLEATVMLAGFMPVIVGLSGNAGNQSAALVARGISLDHVEARMLTRIVFRELRVGLALGLLCGLVLVGFVHLRYPTQPGMAVAVGGSAALSITLAMLFGALSPLVLRRLHLDPNMATGPLVSTIVDVLGISVFFALSTFVLAHLS